MDWNYARHPCGTDVAGAGLGSAAEDAESSQVGRRGGGGRWVDSA